jgi:M6 family metalloprotease-like protein
VFLAAAALALAPHVFVGGEPRAMVEPAQTSSPCHIRSANAVFLSEGPTDMALHVRSTGTLRAVMLFAEFPDAPATESTSALFETIVPQSQEWLHEVSHGRLTFAVDRVDRWYRLPLPSQSYGLEFPTFDSQRAYAEELVKLADAEVDFTPYDVLLIASPPGARIPLSPTFLAYPGAGIRTNEREVRWGVTFGTDVRVADWGGRILAHEVQHMLGLPDLYRFGSLSFPDFIRDAGGWDLMSWIRPGAHDLVWHKRKLGWVDESQIVCATTSVEVELRASASQEGPKAIVMPLDGDTALVAEVRKPVDRDAKLCDSGVLVYTVDAATATGQGPVVVHAAGTGEDPQTMNRCGAIYDAAFDARAGKPSRITQGNIVIDVLSSNETGARVRVTRGQPRRRAIRH